MTEKDAYEINSETVTDSESDNSDDYVGLSGRLNDRRETKTKQNER